MKAVDISNLDDDQKHAAIRITSTITNTTEKNNLTPIVMCAPGGSGKTHVLRLASTLMSAAMIQHKTACFTGRAASQVAKEGLPNTSTLHSLMMKAVLDANGDLLYFEDKPDEEVAADIGEGLLVDEGSMVPHQMFQRLMNICTRYGVKLVLVGDSAQLPPIEPPQTKGFNIMDLQPPTVERISLRTNYRQKEGSAIADLAMHLRDNASIPRRKSQDLRMLPKSRVLKLDFHQKNHFDVILCGTNKIRRRLNNLVRTARGFEDEYPVEGEVIICKRNDIVNEQRINNGELYRVESRFPSNIEGCHDYMLSGMDNGITVRVRIPDVSWGEEEKFGRKLNGHPVQQFSFGYAITTHSAQGSQFPRVLFFDEDVSYFLDQQKWRYTAVSRASEYLVIAQ